MDNHDNHAPVRVATPPLPYLGDAAATDDPDFGSLPRALEALTITANNANIARIGWLPILSVAFNLTGKQGEKACTEFGVQMYGSPSGFPSPTPRLHLSIAYLEARAFAWITTHDPDSVVFSLTRRVCLNVRPNGRIYDFRVANTFFPEVLDSRVRPHVCGHDPLECSCAVPTHAYFGPDIGCFTPEAVVTILEQTQRRSGYAIFPRVSNIAGELQDGDTTYYYADASTIVFTPKNGRPIRMLDPKWIHSGFHCASAGTLVATVIEEVNGWVLYNIRLLDVAGNVVDPSDGLEWTSFDDLSNVTGATYALPQGSGKPQTTNFDWAVFKLRRIHVLSTVAVFTTEDQKKIVFSKDFAWLGCRQFQNQPRNALTLARVTRYATGKYNSLTMLPEQLKYPAQLATVVFIMSHCIPDETAALTTLVRDCSRFWQVHSETIAFRPPLVITPRKIVAGIAYTALTAYTVHSVGINTMNAMSSGNVLSGSFGHQVVWHALSVKMSAVAIAATAPYHMPLTVPLWCLATSAAACWSWYKSHAPPDSRINIIDWANTPADEQPPPLPPGVYSLPDNTRFGATAASKVSFPEQDPRCKVIDAPFHELKPPTAKVVAVGICLQEIPRYHESNAANEAAALRNRTTIKTPAPKPGLWLAVANAYLAHNSVLPLIAILHEPESKFWFTKDAVCRYAAKFPPGRRIELLNAFDEFRTRGFRYYDDDFKASMFIKGELHVKPSFDGETPQHYVDEATPRAIISFRPIVNATLGPLVQFYSDVERGYRRDQLHDETKLCPICPQGINGEERGQWFTWWVNHFGGPEACYVLSKDSRKHDAHHSADSRVASAMTNIDLVQCSRPEIKAVYRRQMTVKGKSAHGVIFFATSKRWSGESSTSKANTHTTEQKLCYSLEGPKVTGGLSFESLGVNYAIAGEGDDGCAVIRGSWLDASMPGDKSAIIRARCLELGFDDVIVLNPGCDGDFCSRWWYPVGGGYLPGGKIGRVLAKAGFFYDNPDEMNVRSAAIGALRDHGHVPFLREYFERVRFLAKKQGVGLKGKPKEYSIHMERSHEYDDSTLDFVETKYGLTRQDLVEWKLLLSQVKRIPVVVSWPHLEKCLAIDSA